MSWARKNMSWARKHTQQQSQQSSATTTARVGFAKPLLASQIKPLQALAIVLTNDREALKTINPL